MGTHAEALQLPLIASEGQVESARPTSPARAKHPAKARAASPGSVQPDAKPIEAGLVERRSGQSRRPFGLGGRRATDRVESRPAEAARAAPATVPSPSSPLPPENELWDLRAAARFLKLSTSWVYKRVEDGTLPVTRVNGYSLRFDPAALRDWLATNASTRRAVKRNKK